MQDKQTAAIHYVISKCDPQDLGATKLAKVLLYADVEQFRRTGRTITGAAYQKRDHGPLAVGFNDAIRTLKDRSLIAERWRNHFGHRQRQFWAVEEADVSAFSPQEVALLSQMADFICASHSAASISDISHNLAWKLAADGEEIPISAFLAAERAGTVSNDEWADIEARLAAVP